MQQHPKCGMHGHDAACSERHGLFADHKGYPMQAYGRGQMPKRVAEQRLTQEHARMVARKLAESGVNNRLASERTVPARMYESCPKRVIKRGLVTHVRVGHSLMPVAPHAPRKQNKRKGGVYIEVI